jgi:hypothetical protein
MEKKFESVLNDGGMPAVGASVLVTAVGGGAVTIYADNGTTPKANPILTDATGYFEYYAPDGRYTWNITGSGFSSRTITDILHEDPQDGNPSTVSTLVATGQSSLGGQANTESLRVSAAPVGAVNRVQTIGTITGGEPQTGVQGSDADINYGLYAKGNGAIIFRTGATTNGGTGSVEQFRITHTATAVNTLALTGAVTTGSPAITAQGTDANIAINYNAKGTGSHQFNNGNIVANTLGFGLRIREGVNSKMDVATLVAGTVTIANTSITANSRVFAFCQTPGGTPGFLRCSARSAGVNYTILSSSGTDTSVIAVMIVEPAP